MGAGEREEKGPPWLAEVWRQVAPLRYGAVHITVHAGQVVQIERTERFRAGEGFAEKEED